MAHRKGPVTEMSISALERLRRFYDTFSEDDKVLIVINADPDAISSAMAIQRLLWRRVSGLTISNINIIERPDNLAMIRLLGVKLIHINKVKERLYNRFILVDSQPDHHECFSMFRPDVIIDHHPLTCNVAAYSDIRPEYGATATMMTEYVRAAKIRPSVKLATALFQGIKTDTSNFERQGRLEDVRAFHFLYKYVNLHIARQIEHAEIRLDFLDYYSKALKNRVIKKGRVFVHLDEIVNPDVCVLIADFFMRVSTIQWSIVSGVYQNRLVIIFRNDGIRKNAGRTAQKLFGDVGDAGGHKSMARAEIELDDLGISNTTKKTNQLAKWIINRFK